MDENEVMLRALRLLALLLACFIVSIRAGCSVDKYIKLKETELIVGTFEDPIAQRLWAAKDIIPHLQPSNYDERAKMRADVVSAILASDDVDTAVAQVTGEPTEGQARTNAASAFILEK